jgi:hypothetical protein
LLLKYEVLVLSEETGSEAAMCDNIARSSSDSQSHIKSWLPNEVFCKKVNPADGDANYTDQQVQTQYKRFPPHAFIKRSSGVEVSTPTHCHLTEILQTFAKAAGAYICISPVEMFVVALDMVTAVCK